MCGKKYYAIGPIVISTSSLSYTEADSPTTNSAKTVSSSNKRRWDQETTDEPFHKKADTWQAIRQEEYPEISDKIVTDIDSSAKTPEVDEEEKSSDVNKEAPKKMSGFSIGIKKNKASPAPIKITLGSQKPKEAPVTLPKTKLSAAAASAFNDEEDSEEEEMPPEAKMRMRNIGRETPTAAGPNSFGKGRLGFCDRQRMIQKEIEKEIQKLQDS
ncbi:hypothetical protein LSH36_100g10013 [Paralvinella palmiformis]|uniref:PEST proteolytic signal-containing nuclear protein n=1 Tax=Paralvinella palmiformis TaxID=53620 RepID=A0AAD9NCN6_9ANNE|nr:hypothetical protein LSH36_100g10013 [Paralvinella palmiformis]